MADKLSAKQSLFVKEYLTDHNATQAAIRAGYSEKCATEQGYENLRKPHIIKELHKRQLKITQKLEMTAESLLSELANIANHEVGKKIENPKDYIKGHSGPTYGDKLSAIDKAMKHLGMFKDDGTALNINVKIEGRDADCG